MEMKTLRDRIAHSIFILQCHLGLNEAEFKATMLIGALLLAGAGVRLTQKTIPPYDQNYYAIFDSTFRALTARSDSLDALLLSGKGLGGNEIQDVDADSRRIKLEIPDSSRIDLNTATSIELMTLKGVGPAMARRILEMRLRLGRFQSETDLLLVSGIGEKTLERIKPFVRVLRNNR